MPKKQATTGAVHQLPADLQKAIASSLAHLPPKSSLFFWLNLSTFSFLTQIFQ